MSDQISGLEAQIAYADRTILISKALAFLLLIACVLLVIWKSTWIASLIPVKPSERLLDVATKERNAMVSTIIQKKEKECADVVARVEAAKKLEIARKECKHKATLAMVISEKDKECANVVAAITAEIIEKNQEIKRLENKHVAGILRDAEQNTITAGQEEKPVNFLIEEKFQDVVEARQGDMIEKIQEMEMWGSMRRAAMTGIIGENTDAVSICSPSLVEKSQESDDVIELENGIFGKLACDFDFLIVEQRHERETARIIKIQCSGVSHKAIHCEVILNGCIVTVHREESAGCPQAIWTKKFQFSPADGLFEFQEDWMELDQGCLTIVFLRAHDCSPSVILQPDT